MTRVNPNGPERALLDVWLETEEISVVADPMLKSGKTICALVKDTAVLTRRAVSFLENNEIPDELAFKR